MMTMMPVLRGSIIVVVLAIFDEVRVAATSLLFDEVRVAATSLLFVEVAAARRQGRFGEVFGAFALRQGRARAWRMGAGDGRETMRALMTVTHRSSVDMFLWARLTTTDRCRLTAVRLVSACFGSSIVARIGCSFTMIMMMVMVGLWGNGRSSGWQGGCWATSWCRKRGRHPSIAVEAGESGMRVADRRVGVHWVSVVWLVGRAVGCWRLYRGSSEGSRGISCIGEGGNGAVWA